jgi:multiple sugar transport system permease protein
MKTFARYLNLVLLALITLMVLIPILWALKAVFTPTGEIFSTGIFDVPSRFSLENIRNGLATAPFLTYFKTSLVVALIVTFSIVITSAMAGFGFAKFHFKGKNFLFAFVIMAMLMPFQAILIPLFIEVKYFGMA